MLSSPLLFAALSTSVLAQSYSSGAVNYNNYTLPNGTVDPFQIFTINSTNISASFIPYGARLTSLLVPDRSGVVQDIVVGYDDPIDYLHDSETNHTFFGAVVGRYANRIKNGTFEIQGQTYQIPENEHGGIDTLHGGTVGYDQRNWTVLSYSSNSVTFAFLDNALEGFPGTVYTQATYTVSSGQTGPMGQLQPRLTLKMTSNALNEATPIMLANHIYWNLNAFKSPTIINDTTLWMPYADRFIDIDNIEVPNGTLSTVASYPPLDFTVPKLIGRDIYNAHLAGYNSTGYDNAYILDRPRGTNPESANFPVVSIWSQDTGIKMDISTNQQGIQVYSCVGQNGTIPVKPSQIARNNGTGADFINKYGCIVFETQDWIDGINQPEWGRGEWQIYSPTTVPFVNWAAYDFSTFA